MKNNAFSEVEDKFQDMEDFYFDLYILKYIFIKKIVIKFKTYRWLSNKNLYLNLDNSNKLWYKILQLFLKIKNNNMLFLLKFKELPTSKEKLHFSSF